MPPKKRQKVILGVRLLEPREEGTPAVDLEKLRQRRTEFEEKFKIRLPDEYVRLLEQSSTPRFMRAYAPIASEPGKFAHVTAIAGLVSAAGDGDESLPFQSDEMIEEWQIPDEDGRLVLLSGDGHEWLALKYPEGEPASPSVVALAQSEGDEDDWNVRIVANTFSEFLSNLSFREPDSAVLALLPATPAMVAVDAAAMLAEVGRLVGNKDALVCGSPAKLWQKAGFLEDGQPQSAWFLTITAGSARECSEAASSLVPLLAPSFTAQVIAEPIDSADVICVLEQ